MVNIDVLQRKMAIFSCFRDISGFGRAPEEPFRAIFRLLRNSYVYRG